VRKPGEDETDQVAHKLRDLVDLQDVHSLSSRSAIYGEQRPDVRKMRSEGWVSREPEANLEIICEGKEREAMFVILE
jgi:hypothetical protein